MADKEETIKKKIRGYTVNMPRRKVLAVDWETGEVTSKIVECRWFHWCDDPATTTVKHPIVGDVPTCQRCADSVEAWRKQLTD